MRVYETGGRVPVVGDVSHVFWEANRRNYRLLIRERQQPRAKTWRDWIFLLVIMVGALAVIAIPIFILVWLVRTHIR
jgi:hypothetical protein